MSDSLEVQKAILARLNMFWMVLKWFVILACALAVFLYCHHQIRQTEDRSDNLERGTADPVFNIREAEREAKKRIADFDHEIEEFNRTNK